MAAKAKNCRINAAYWLINPEAKGYGACVIGVMTTEIETSGVVFREIQSPNEERRYFLANLHIQRRVGSVQRYILRTMVWW